MSNEADMRNAIESEVGDLDGGSMLPKRVLNGKSVSVKFDGGVEEVDLNTFTRVVLDYTTVVKACAREADPNTTLTTSIRAVRPGCLVVDLGVIVEGIGGLFKDSATTLQTVVNVIEIAGGLYGFKMFLGTHGKAKKLEHHADDVQVVAEDGAVTSVPTTVVNVYVNSPEASSAINSTFSTLDADGRVEALEIGEGMPQSFRVNRDEFSVLATSPSYEGPDTRHHKERCELTIVKPVLSKTTKRRWEFVWRGMKMSANIVDEDFMERMHEESFTVGSVMDAEIDVTQQFDPNSRAYMNKSFTVTKVFEIAKPEKGSRLF